MTLLFMIEALLLDRIDIRLKARRYKVKVYMLKRTGLECYMSIFFYLLCKRLIIKIVVLVELYFYYLKSSKTDVCNCFQPEGYILYKC